MLLTAYTLSKYNVPIAELLKRTWVTFALVAGGDIVNESVFIRRNQIHSQLDKIPESQKIFYSQQISKGIGSNLH